MQRKLHFCVTLFFVNSAVKDKSSVNSTFFATLFCVRMWRGGGFIVWWSKLLNLCFSDCCLMFQFWHFLLHQLACLLRCVLFMLHNYGGLFRFLLFMLRGKSILFHSITFVLGRVQVCSKTRCLCSAIC
jgi:hypothetical protein